VRGTGLYKALRDFCLCWMMQLMMRLEDIWFVSAFKSPIHDPGRRKDSRPCEGPALARTPVWYRSSQVALWRQDRTPLGDLKVHVTKKVSVLCNDRKKSIAVSMHSRRFASRLHADL
jgi:hypothetical protein